MGVGEHTAYLSRDNTRHFFSEMRLYGANGMLGGTLNRWSDCSTMDGGVFRPARKCLEKKPQSTGSESRRLFLVRRCNFYAGIWLVFVQAVKTVPKRFRLMRCDGGGA